MSTPTISEACRCWPRSATDFRGHASSAADLHFAAWTAPAVPWGDCEPVLEQFQAGASFTIGDIEVTSFSIPHDAADPVGFSLRAEGIKISIATDLGYLPDSVRVHLRGSDVLLLESNHDLEMLKVGPYPWSIKQRVMSRMGHLSNDAASSFIREDLDARTSTLILGHISESNNHPALVEQAASARPAEGRQSVHAAGDRRSSRYPDVYLPVRHGRKSTFQGPLLSS